MEELQDRSRRLSGTRKRSPPTKYTDLLALQRLDHLNCSLELRYFLFQASSPGQTVRLHVAILAVYFLVAKSLRGLYSRTGSVLREHLLQRLQGHLRVSLRPADVALDIILVD